MERSAFEWRQKIETKEKIKVGMNKYQVKEEMEVNLHSPDLKAEAIMVERVKKFRKDRDSKKTEAALAELKKVAVDVRDNWPKASGEFMPCLVEAVRTEATLGESMGVLKEVFGWSYIY